MYIVYSSINIIHIITIITLRPPVDLERAVLFGAEAFILIFLVILSLSGFE